MYDGSRKNAKKRKKQVKLTEIMDYDRPSFPSTERISAPSTPTSFRVKTARPRLASNQERAAHTVATPSFPKHAQYSRVNLQMG